MRARSSEWQGGFPFLPDPSAARQHVKSAVVLVSLCGLAAVLGVQAVTPPAPRRSPPPKRFFRVDSTKALSDTAAFTTSLGGNYSYRRNDNAHFRWDNGLALRMHNQLAAAVRTEYLVGIATNDEGARYMDRRRWRVSGNLDLNPTTRVSPFLLAIVESNIELKFIRRTSEGVGAKLTLYRWAPDSSQDTARTKLLPSDNNRLDASLALLAEHNVLPPVLTPVPGTETLPRNLARLSWRFRWSHRITDRVWIDHTTWFKPELLALHRYNAELNTKLHYALTRRTKLTLTSLHNYEGSAQSRGAGNNRSGSLDRGRSVNVGRPLRQSDCRLDAETAALCWRD